MKDKFKFEFTAKIILATASIVFILIIGVSFIRGESVNPLKNVVNTVLMPIQKGIHLVGQSMAEDAAQLATLKDVQKENELLKEQVANLLEQISISDQEHTELLHLRELYDLNNQYPSYETIGARVIGKDSGNWFHYFLIDKGADDGIKEDMNIIAQGGLVGIVTEVGKTSSKVLAIIDDTSNVSAMSATTQDSCMVSGDLEQYEEGALSLMYINKDDQIVEGDKILTSNTSNKYLPGILIGYAKNIEVDSNNLTKSGQLIPVVDFEHLDTVLVITTLKDGWDDFKEVEEPTETASATEEGQ